MITTYKELWKFPRGIKLTFFDERIDFKKDLYFIGIEPFEHQYEYWDGYQFLVDEDILPEELWENDEYKNIKIIVYPYGEENVKVLYNALLAKVATWVIEDSNIMKEEIENTINSIQALKKLLKE